MRSRWPVVVAVAVVVLGVPGVVVARKAAGLRELGTPVRQVTTDAPAPAALPAAGAPVRWTVRSDGRVTDVAVLPARGLVIYVEEVAHRSWRATAVDGRTGAVRWSNARSHTGHIEAWAVTDAAVVLAYHHSASRLAWRTHRAASFEGIDPVSGKVLWTRHVYNLLGARPGDYAPTLAGPAENIVYARTEFGVPNAVDTRTGQTLWEYPGLNDCQARADEIVAGPGGVAISQRCPKGKERIALVNPHTGKALWKLDISTPSLRLLAVGSDSVAVYQGGLIQQVIILGPGGVAGAQIPCACSDGAALAAGSLGGTVLAGGPAGGRIGVGGYLLLGGPFGLVGADGETGKILWQKPVAGGPVHRVMTQDGDAHIVSGDGALLRVNPADGAMKVLVPVAGGDLDPDAIVVPVGGYLAAGSAKGFAFTGPLADSGV
ncbi:MAG TPA: PQQ-binding-like beta-propeller repeat protein [Acidimicrobiia bacterium]|nr:PQQ-binding-like beta-propeller repeat protein [Acidimicrobiia bacterium]